MRSQPPASAAGARRRPLVAQIYAAREAHLPIDDQQLAVVSVIHDADAEAGTPRRDRVVLLDLTTRVAQSGEHPAVALDTSDCVVDHAHFHAGFRFGDQCIGKLLADTIRRKPVHLEEDLALGLRNRFQHRGERLLTVV
jgi:hypothetical protein